MSERKGVRARFEREWLYLSGLVRTLLRVRSIAAHSTNLIDRRSRSGRGPLARPSGAQLRRQDADLRRAGCARQPLRPLGRQRGPAPRRGGGAADAQPARVPADLVRPLQGRRRHRADQQPADRRGAGALPEHLRRRPLPGRRRDLAGVRGRQGSRAARDAGLGAGRRQRRPARPDASDAQLLATAARPRAARGPDGARHRALHLHQRHHRAAQGRAHHPHARPALHARLRRRDGRQGGRPHLRHPAASTTPPAGSAARARRC